MLPVLDDPRLAALRSAPLDSWIALSEDETRIVAVGATYEEVARNSELAGVEDPVIVKTPKSWLPLSVGVSRFHTRDSRCTVADLLHPRC
jgi:hypothetical protein